MSGQCVYNCHLSHNNYTSAGDAPGGVALQSVKDYGNGFVAYYAEGAAYLNGVKLPWTPAEADIHIPRAMKALGGGIYGEIGSEDNVENTFNALIAYCNRSCSVEDYNELSIPWLLFLGETGALSGNGRGGNAPLAKSVQKFVKQVCGRNSFTGDTLVLMADGSTKRIDEIKLGDHVLATDPETKESGSREVTATIIGEGVKSLIELEVGGVGKIIATDGHPFWLPNLKSWTEAKDLHVGSVLRTSAGAEVQVTATRNWVAVERVYNLTIDGIHTYYVMAADTPVLVHNTGVCWRTEFDSLAPGNQKHVRTVSNTSDLRAIFDRWTKEPILSPHGVRRSRKSTSSKTERSFSGAWVPNQVAKQLTSTHRVENLRKFTSNDQCC